MDDSFLAALRDAGIPEANLEKMLQDKVDQDVVRMMDEETLSKYIPHFEDRVFAQNWTDSAKAKSTASKKRKFMKYIQAKMKLPRSGQATSSSANQTCSGLGVGNKNAAQNARQIELGWMNYQDGNFRQVGRLTGGGTRQITARNDDTLKKILEDGKSIFFRKDKSSKLRVENFDFALCVMGSQEPLDDTLTVGELYDTTHPKILRLHICSKKRQRDESDLSESSARAKSPERSQAAEAPTSPFHIMSSERSWTPLSLDGPNPNPSCSPFMHAGEPSASISNLTPASQTRFKPSMAHTFSVPRENEAMFLYDDGNISLDVPCDILIHQPFFASEQQASDNVTELQVDSHRASSARDSGIIQQIENPEPMTEAQTSNLVPTNSEPDIFFDSQSVQSSPFEVMNQDEISNHTSTIGSYVNFYDNPENIVEKQIIIIRTVYCLSDMVEAFSDENILDANIGFRRVLKNGETENGVGSGLAMDCLTDFWKYFYSLRTSGTTYKIPKLNHAFQERKWKAVARILAFGWQRFKYLPVQLAPPFLNEALSIPVKNCSLTEAFLNYINPSKKDALTRALTDFKGADVEELLTILSSHNCTTLPTEQNLPILLQEIAHKELIQQPSYIIKCWKPVLQTIGRSLSHGVLDKILADLQPNARSITKYVQFPNAMSSEEKATSLHLLRFVREMDEGQMGLFLRFCTGSDLFLSKTIKVTFTDMPEFSRRPVAHTCTCGLELACNYSTYSEFRSEFLSVLQSGIWLMDMY